MPTIYFIDSIKILIYFDDHMPPHFHAQYNEFEVLVEIESLSVYAGGLPNKQMKKVLVWAELNQDLLWEKWNAFHQ